MSAEGVSRLSAIAGSVDVWRSRAWHPPLFLPTGDQAAMGGLLHCHMRPAVVSGVGSARAAVQSEGWVAAWAAMWQLRVVDRLGRPGRPSSADRTGQDRAAKLARMWVCLHVQWSRVAGKLQLSPLTLAAHRLLWLVVAVSVAAQVPVRPVESSAGTRGSRRPRACWQQRPRQQAQQQRRRRRGGDVAGQRQELVRGQQRAERQRLGRCRRRECGDRGVAGDEPWGLASPSAGQVVGGACV